MEEKLKKEKEELFYSKNNSSLSLTTINKEIVIFFSFLLKLFY